MNNDTYRRPIYATLYYAASFFLVVCTALVLLAIASRPDDYRTGPFGLAGNVASAIVIGLGLAILLWGTGQIFDLLGKIEFNTRRPADDATLSLLQEIARNTRALPTRFADDEDPAVYYYREKDGTERGPFKRADLRALLAAGRITPATRIDPERNGVRDVDIAVSDIVKEA
jgi:hypothetical protein